MTIQETIIEALKSVQSAHNSALATIANLRSEKVALETEVARLNAQVAKLKSRVIHLEAESVKIVEPESVRSLLASLAQIVSDGQQSSPPVRSADVHTEAPVFDRPRDEIPIAQRANAFLLPRGENTRDRGTDAPKAADVA